MEMNTAASILGSLSNNHRLSVVYMLSLREMAVSEIGEKVDLSQSALSQHLAVLRRNGMVNTRRKSQQIYYSLAEDKPTRALLKLLATLEQEDNP